MIILKPDRHGAPTIHLATVFPPFARISLEEAGLRPGDDCDDNKGDLHGDHGDDVYDDDNVSDNHVYDDDVYDDEEYEGQELWIKVA